MNWDDVGYFWPSRGRARSRRLEKARHQSRDAQPAGYRARGKLKAELPPASHGCELTAKARSSLPRPSAWKPRCCAPIAGRRIDTAIAGTGRIGAPDGFGVSFLRPRLGRLTHVTGLKLPARSCSALLLAVAARGRYRDYHRTAGTGAARLVPSLPGLYTGLYHRQNIWPLRQPRSVDDLKNHRRIGYVEASDLHAVAQFLQRGHAQLGMPPSRSPAPRARPKPRAPAPASASCITTSPGNIGACTPAPPDDDPTRLLTTITRAPATWCACARSQRFLQELVTAEHQIFV